MLVYAALCCTIAVKFTASVPQGAEGAEETLSTSTTLAFFSIIEHFAV